MLVVFMNEGFILSNKYRRAIFDEFASGENDINRIAKKHHLVYPVVKRIVEEFVHGGLVEKKDTKFVLTEKGEKLVTSMKKG